MFFHELLNESRSEEGQERRPDRDGSPPSGHGKRIKKRSLTLYSPGGGRMQINRPE